MGATDAGRDFQHPAIGQRHLEPQAFADPPGGLKRILFGHIRQHDHEFLAAIAQHAVLLARGLPQGGANMAQDDIAGIMAILIIDRLEMIEVDQQQPGAPCTFHITSKGIAVPQRPPVQQAGQRICDRINADVAFLAGAITFALQHFAQIYRTGDIVDKQGRHGLQCRAAGGFRQKEQHDHAQRQHGAQCHEAHGFAHPAPLAQRQPQKPHQRRDHHRNDAQRRPRPADHQPGDAARHQRSRCADRAEEGGGKAYEQAAAIDDDAFGNGERL
ncbi:MAG: hypothetical protein A2X69_01185 [Rhodobacteraceae bacterium GWF1_65_7]|nr:MAG: hypothetical protein A2X69_01185 [Rhodobacteraceae bacterium GWF1_65_7]